ncbi:MAG: YkgJ family cysteine cluster protein [Phycisphaerales bacterium]|nr:YkgJ family cysteine cluster protein [Phycisphaerales bacterium]
MNPPCPLPISEVDARIDPGVWYAAGLRFQCVQCGRCCSSGPGYVWLTDADLHRIADYLNLPLETFTRTHVRHVSGGQTRFALTEKFNYDCTFLTRDPATQTISCTIYSVRPTQCRTWPFWPHNLKNPQSWQRASATCPGMCVADAPTHALQHIEKCRQHPESPR